MKSWKTTLTGLITLLITIMSGIKAVVDGDPATNVDINEVIGAVVGIGLLFARDNNVTSEQLGLKPTETKEEEKPK